MMDYIIIGLLTVLAALLIAVLVKLSAKKGDTALQEQMDRMQRELREEMRKDTLEKIEKAKIES